jgi:rhodanese-related sulfurtransferase
MKKLYGIIILLSILVSSTIYAQQEEGKIYNINVEQFAKLVEANKGLVLDVRTPDEWEEGVIGEATKIDYWGSDFAEKADKLDKNETILVYCKAGGRSSSAAEVLIEKGFKKVFNLDGGITAWIDAGKELNK